MPQAGDVFIIKQFTFEDQTQRDKWFVVLNVSDLDKPCLVLKTTSKPERYHGCVKGCNKDRKCFFAPRAWQTCFNLDTYIQLPQIFEFPADRLLREGFKGNIEFKPPLTTHCLAQLRSCLATFKDDISPTHWALIYKAKS
jgi:hypothetical protein